MIDPLTKIAIRHGTDKWGLHFYTPVYHKILGHLRESPVRLLEIGVGGYSFKTVGGSSLRMWADYFELGEITGLDIEEKQLPPHDRIKIYRGSQVDTSFLAQVASERGPFDVVIDDGSHIPKHVAISFENIFPHLKKGGFYIIEDVQTAYWPASGGSPLRGSDTMKLVHALIDGLNYQEIAVADQTRRVHPYCRNIVSISAFHNIVVIEKGDNIEPSNKRFNIDNPVAKAAKEVIERELLEHPTPEGYANLVSLLMAGGKIDDARGVALKALDQWPNSSGLVAVGLSLFKATGDTEFAKTLFARMVALEPDKTGLRKNYFNDASG